MLHFHPDRVPPVFKTLPLALICWVSVLSRLSAADYILTIGGGYDRTGNQASLEANVIFFQKLLADKHQGPRHHAVYFADGNDPAADLQILKENRNATSLPATELLAALHRRRGGEQLDYRNHRVPEIAGALDKTLIQTKLDELARTATKGDRLIVYVTAHGSAGPRDDPFNTTIDCWNGQSISAREFTSWLSKFSSEVPVIMVMAQCYCGGFGRVIFEGLDANNGLSPQLRVGFFAQQHNLPAAGCRPDIEHDEEFSSYFWGALAGHSRNGVPIDSCDIDGNGLVSFTEAYAYAVIAGKTIDIPLRTSDVLLRSYSRLSRDDKPGSEGNAERDRGTANLPDPATNVEPAAVTESETLESVVEGSRPVSRRIVTELALALGLALQQEVTAVRAAYDESRRASRRRGPARSRQSSGRRELLREVAEKWPELGDEKKWAQSVLLKPENQDQLLAEIKELPSWKAYDARRQQIEIANRESDEREIRVVMFRKLLNEIERIALERNLPHHASPEVVERYKRLLALEDASLENQAADDGQID